MDTHIDAAAAARGLLHEGRLLKTSFSIWGAPAEESETCALCPQPIERGAVCIEEISRTGHRFRFHPPCHQVLMRERFGTAPGPGATR